MYASIASLTPHGDSQLANVDAIFDLRTMMSPSSSIAVHAHPTTTYTPDTTRMFQHMMQPGIPSLHETPLLSQKAPQDTTSASASGGGAIVAVPGDMAFDEFRTNVRTWLSIDNEIKGLEAQVREKKRSKTQLTEKLLDFMGRYNVEDLNTRDGRLRYKVSSVLAPLSQKKIKERLVTFLESKFKDDDNSNSIIDEAHTALFDRERVDKVSLRRLKTLAFMPT
jgi:Family of unknown function (DUF5760)